MYIFKFGAHFDFFQLKIYDPAINDFKINL